MHGNPFWWLCLTSTCPIVWLPYCTWTDFQAILWCYQLWLRWYQVLLGCLNIYILGLSVMELDSFMCNFDTRRINFVEPCSSSPWLSRWMWCFLRIPPPTHTHAMMHTIRWCFAYLLPSCWIHHILFMHPIDGAFHTCVRRQIPGSCLPRPFRRFVPSSPLPRTVSLHHKMVKTFSPFSTQFFSSGGTSFGLMHSCRHFSPHSFPRSPCILVDSYNNGPV